MDLSRFDAAPLIAFKDWLYLAVILDLHSRRVIGWAVSNRMERDLEARAEHDHIIPYATKGLHPSHGSQVAILSHDYQKILRQHGFKGSM